jgi:hypothetical protein
MRKSLLPAVMVVASLASLFAVGCAEPVSSQALNAASFDSAPESWDGTYKAKWSGAPAIPGQDVPSVGYVLHIATTPAGVSVEINADGSHTIMRMRGEGRPNGNELGVFFVECRADDMSRCSGFHKGDHLFTMRSGHPFRLRFDAMTAPDLKTAELSLDAALGPVDSKKLAIRSVK